MNKTVTVRYFAGFREHAGVGEEQLSVDVQTTGDLFDMLRHKLGSAEPRGHCKVAVNDELVNWNHELSDGDIVLLFPPVAGG